MGWEQLNLIGNYHFAPQPGAPKTICGLCNWAIPQKEKNQKGRRKMRQGKHAGHGHRRAYLHLYS